MTRITIILEDYKSLKKGFEEKESNYVEMIDGIIARLLFDVLAKTMQLFMVILGRENDFVSNEI